MYKNFLVVGLYSCLYACNAGIAKSDSIKAVLVSYSLPLVNPNGNVIPYSSSYKIYCTDSYFLYQYRYKFDSSFSGKLILSEEREGFFVFHKDSSYGYSLDEKTASRNNKRLPVDSILNSIEIDESKLNGIMNYNADSSFIEGNLVTDIYKFTAEKNGGQAYTALLTYDTKIREVNASLSVELDAKKK